MIRNMKEKEQKKEYDYWSSIQFGNNSIYTAKNK
jgi:hypothetical protein